MRSQENLSKKYQIFLENSDDLIFQCDFNGIIKYINHAIEKILGFREEEVIDRLLYDVIIHQKYQEIHSKFLKIKETNSDSPVNVLSNVQTKTGNHIWLTAKIIPLKNSIGVITDFLGICRDVTFEINYKKQLEEMVKSRTHELRQSENKYRRLYENMMDGYVFVDMDGKIKEFNEPFRKMIGYSEEEMKSLTFQQITPQKWHEMETNIIKSQIYVRGYSDVYEKEYIHKNGNIIPIELRSYLNYSEDAELEGMWAIVRDISFRKKAENHILDMMIQAQAANRAKSYFLENMSHELRTPLNGIIGFSSLLQMSSSKNSEEIHEIANQINRSGLDLLKIIERVLNVSSLEKNFVHINKTKFSLIELIEKLKAKYFKQWIVKKLSIQIINPKNINEILSDKEKFTIILENIFENAIKYANLDSKIMFFVDLDAQKIMISIENEGIGIEPQNYDKVFQPFEQLDMGLNKTCQGIGLGLYLTKLLVNYLNGTIFFSSNIEEKTIFTINIPQ